MSKEQDGVWRTVGGRRIFIAKGQSLSDAMMKSGKFKKENRDTKYGDKKISNKKEYDSTVSALNYLLKQRGQTKDVKEKAKLDRVIQNYSKNLQEYLRENPTQEYHAGRLSNLKSGEDGTFDLDTQKSKSYSDGYQVTFSTIGMKYNDEEYSQLVTKFRNHDHGTVDAGKFEGSAEISFNVTDFKTAAKLGYKYNQISIWDWKNSREIPTGGSGKWKKEE